MLENMTENCYENQWKDFFEKEDGYLCYANVGETAVSYKVETIEKIEDGYIANVIVSSEETDKTTVEFKINADKCIVESYDFI